MVCDEAQGERGRASEQSKGSLRRLTGRQPEIEAMAFRSEGFASRALRRNRKSDGTRNGCGLLTAGRAFRSCGEVFAALRALGFLPATAALGTTAALHGATALGSEDRNQEAYAERRKGRQHQDNAYCSANKRHAPRCRRTSRMPTD